ncbi:uncharacterized protein LOC122057512 [Macadamia integrifolia]|uniref:uncharacterized protein LOC122057512 n=1 Tax=Macadamia integrifolia TaxID=60698 RepID=UPI001C532F7B|nr:uncharacterized protein LOC122057512 [Macadamia integrifolia]XP_042475565.1 uncharacterized protein LOC122057512 [Macadamia integrifolia]XP_042475566.1 uncharacterized protein LOC122057512 [Macadamia integrifolia]
MEPELEPMPIGSQKRDLAWKHCQMFKIDNRVRLKCIYCGKMFSGGGIHRIKEHLAGHKGNGATCPRVHPDVRHIMRQSLDGSIVRMKKKQKMTEETAHLLLPPNEAETYTPQCEAINGLQLLAAPNPVESNLVLTMKEEEGATENNNSERWKRVAVGDPSSASLGEARPIRDLSLQLTKGNDQVHMAIGRFLYDAGVPLDAVSSVYFQPMIDAIALEGPGLKPPTYHDLRGWILKNSVEEVKKIVDQYQGTWGRTGCSVLADEWTAEGGKILINILVYCPEGTMFLKSVDASEIIRSPAALYELLKEVVEDVGVQHVLQVVTDSAEHYIEAGKSLTETFPTIYWTPCSARCIDLMLEDFGKFEWVNAILEQAKSVTRFVYNHIEVLNMMQRYTHGKDLIQPAVTRSATNFTILQSMVSLKDSLQAMVTSQEWMDSSYSKNPDGLELIDAIYSQSFWSSCVTIIHLTDPLLHVLRIVGSKKRPAMGYIYEAIYRAKGAIKRELVERKDYLTYWNVVDYRWNRQLRRHLHAAGFYLNPKCFYSIEGDVPNEIMSGMLDCIERLVPDTKIQDKITKELNSYKNAAGDLGRKMAIRARHTMLPVEWWSTYGGGCPNLARLAIRILSQTCSANGFKQNQISFKQFHHQRRNRIEHQRLSDLIFVQYNLRSRLLLHRKNKELDALDPISFDNIDTVEDWVTEKENPSAEYGDSDWRALVQPAANTMLPLSPNDESEGFVAGFEDDEIHNGVKVEDENDIETQLEDDGDGELGHRT